MASTILWSSVFYTSSVCDTIKQIHDPTDLTLRKETSEIIGFYALWVPVLVWEHW
jgi:hypothetical protein